MKHPDVARLRTVPLFEGLADDELTRIASWLDVAELRAGTSITSEGDPGCEFFVLDEGTVDVMHEGRKVASLSRDDVFGELAILGGGQRTAEAVATTDVVILQMFGTHFREMQAMTPVVDERLRRLAAERSGPLDATD